MVCLCVCWTQLIVSVAKTAEPIGELFGLQTHGAACNHVFDGGFISRARGSLEEQCGLMLALL